MARKLFTLGISLFLGLFTAGFHGLHELAHRSGRVDCCDHVDDVHGPASPADRDPQDPQDRSSDEQESRADCPFCTFLRTSVLSLFNAVQAPRLFDLPSRFVPAATTDQPHVTTVAAFHLSRAPPSA